MTKKNWRDIKEGENLVRFEDNRNKLQLEFLDDGVLQENVEITRKDGSTGIIKANVSFNVLDLDNSERGILNVNASRLRTAIANLNIKNMTGYGIELIRNRGRKDTENTFEANILYTPESKKK